MTQREYNKYHQDVYDALDRHIDIGDTVVVNNYYRARIYIGKVSHFVESGRVAIDITSVERNHTYKWKAYRFPSDIVIIKKTRKKK